jgi:hypothetical protein
LRRLERKERKRKEKQFYEGKEKETAAAATAVILTPGHASFVCGIFHAVKHWESSRGE